MGDLKSRVFLLDALPKQWALFLLHHSNNLDQRTFAFDEEYHVGAGFVERQELFGGNAVDEEAAGNGWAGEGRVDADQAVEAQKPSRSLNITPSVMCQMFKTNCSRKIRSA